MKLTLRLLVDLPLLELLLHCLDLECLLLELRLQRCEAFLMLL